MKSKPNVRGGGKKDREIADLKKEVAEQVALINQQQAYITKQEAVLDEAIEKIKTLTEGKSSAAKPESKFSDKPKPDIPERIIGAAARRLYLEEVGDDFELCLENCRSKRRAFASQNNAKQRDFETYVEGPPGWGPNITPYEDRMNNAQIIKLKKIIDTEMKRCKEIVREELERQIEEGAQTHLGPSESSSAKPSTSTSAAAAASPFANASTFAEGCGATSAGRCTASAPMADRPGSKLPPGLPPEPVIDFEITDELVAEWAKWQKTRGGHTPPHLKPVMDALQRADFGGYPVPAKVEELSLRMVQAIQAEQIKAQPVQQSSPQAVPEGTASGGHADPKEPVASSN